MSKQSELKPCPFCGGEAQMIEGDGAFSGRVQIDCTVCRNATWWWDEAVAIRSWNRRAALAASAEPVAWINYNAATGERTVSFSQESELASTPLYASPPREAGAVPSEMSPEFTDSARAALTWVLYHHQGGSSPVGQPIRFALGMGAHEPLKPSQIGEALNLAKQSHWSWSRDLPNTDPVAEQQPIAYLSTRADLWAACRIKSEGSFTVPVYAAPVSRSGAVKVADEREALESEVDKAIDALIYTAWYSGEQDGSEGVSWNERGDSYNAMLRDKIQDDKRKLVALLYARSAPTTPLADEAVTGDGATIKEGLRVGGDARDGERLDYLEALRAKGVARYLQWDTWLYTCRESVLTIREQIDAALSKDRS